MGTIKCEAWLVVQGKRSQYGPVNKSGQRRLDSVKVLKVQQSRPTIEGMQEAVKVIIEFPDDYFDNNSPEITVTIPKPDPSDMDIQTVAVVNKTRQKTTAAAVIGGP